ncbi:glycosyltransferase family 39 protein [Sphingobium nicotianae]|uniref:Polyprenol-phosphate-mannose--protein mannosyltransferase n=1 Tax=Sphingobium nicotianae TaxID=2782607 RepID=A0A9X1IRZ8_9SPHN|nr:glycosyltransferase family 39 protein [Sphingobium nicotianae]MBT2187635.1 glycosyltransferase family 39 protein [Sphingobium nicotianae]
MTQTATPQMTPAPRPARPFTAPDWRDRGIAALFALAALALFLFRLSDPAKLDFDETHYVPAVRTLLTFTDLPNAEHPPLAKWLIGFGMALCGDNPFGWRIMSVVFGAVLVFAGVMAARWLLATRAAATMTGALLLVSPMLFIQSRIAMLDIFVASFLMLAFWMMAAAGRDGFRSRPRLMLAGLFLGCAVACKWTAIPLVATAIGLYVALRWRDRSATPQQTSFVEGLMWLGPFAILVYLASFLPYLFLQLDAVSLGGIIPRQWEMYKLQSSPMASHTYQSVWWQWVLMIRPIWYFYEPLDGIQRGVLFIGNPAIGWGGLVALLLCLYAGLRQGQTALLVIPLLWVVSVAFFVIIPKPVMFYYHYFPASLLLCFAIAGVLDRAFWQAGNRVIPALAIGFCALLFLEFYPIISAAPLGDPQDFNRWMWLDSWR